MGYRFESVCCFLTQQSSEAGQVLCLKPELPGGLRQQVLVCGQVLAVPAQFERVRGEVGGYVAEGELRILSDQTGKSVVSVQRQHFLVVVLQSLYNLRTQNGQKSAGCVVKKGHVWMEFDGGGGRLSGRI